MPDFRGVRSFGIGLVLATAAALIALIGAELALAVADYPPKPTSHQHLFVEYDSTRGWRNIPNARGRFVTSEYSVELHYNGHAYRGPLHQYAKPSGVYRVVLLGDSYLEGYTVTLQNRVAEVAAAELEKAAGPRPVEVITLGTAGYSTDQELLWLENEGLRYAPDLVVLFFVNNDYWYNIRGTYPRGAKPLFRMVQDSLVLTNVPVPMPAPPPVVAESKPANAFLSAKRFLGQHSRVYQLAERAVRHTAWLEKLGTRVGLLEAPGDGWESADGVPAEFSVREVPPSPAADSAITMTTKLLAKMHQVVNGEHGRFSVILVPGGDALYPPGALQSGRFHRTAPYGNPARPSQLFREVCQRAAISCIDPTDRFIAAARSLSHQGKLLIFPEDGHWNEHGHQVAAQVLVDVVRAAMDSSLNRVN